MDVPAELKDLSATLASIESVVGLDKLRREIALVRICMGLVGTWDMAQPSRAARSMALMIRT